MTSPFDALAARYSELWDAQAGNKQRLQVWHEIRDLFSAADSVLDLGCGPGDDALHLSQQGMQVTAIDASQPMVHLARARGIDARQLRIEELTHLQGTFDGAISNFGALNCVKDLSAFSGALAGVLREGAPFALCVLSRFHWRETVAFSLRLQFAKAVRRWPGHASWRGMDIYYRRASEWTGGMAPHFQLIRRTAIGGGDHQLYIFRRVGS